MQNWRHPPRSLHHLSRSFNAIVDDNNHKNDNVVVVVDICPHDYAADLNVTNFNAVLRDTPATFAVVEFLVHCSLFYSFTTILLDLCFVNGYIGIFKEMTSCGIVVSAEIFIFVEIFVTCGIGNPNNYRGCLIIFK